MRIWTIMALSIAAMLMVSCGGSKPSPGNELNLPQAEITEKSVPLPSWFVELPQDESFHYERGEGTEAHMEDAESIARQNAASRLAMWLRSRVEETFNRTRTRLGEAGQLHAAFERVVQSITSEVLVGVEPSPGHLDARVTQDGTYHVYLLLRMPRDQSFSSFKETLSKEEELYEAFIKDKLMEEFKNDIEDYKADLKQRTGG